MAIANVCQTCGRVQGRLRALALPAVITTGASPQPDETCRCWLR
jgi:hypothetical protein